jgi:hypothetical protein
VDDIVAVEVLAPSGGPFFVMTFGRVQESVDPSQLEEIVLENAPRFSGIDDPTSARVCWSLRIARDAPYFYECLIEAAAELAVTPTRGLRYKRWRQRTDREMRAGQHLWYLGDPSRVPDRDVD